MHGGAHGSGGPVGRRNGNYRHGRFTKASAERKRWIRELIRQIGTVGQQVDDAMASMRASRPQPKP
jgi:hypothetical protein